MFTPNYAALISAARNGNPNAMEALYNTTFQGVYYTAKKLTGNAQDAEELAQETYIKIFSSLDQIQNPEVFPAWANRVAANITVSYLRKSRPVLFATDEQEALTLGSIPETAEDFLPAEFVQNQDKREKLMAALEELPEKQRTAIYMHYFSEMPIKDMAEELGVNENTVKSRLNAGRTAIRAKLEKLGITSAAAMALTAALRVDSQAALVPAAARSAVWGGVASAAAAAVSASSTTAAVGAGAAGAGMAAGAATATAAGMGATTAVGAGATAAAVTVKAGLFASLGAKIAAGVLAGVIAISGGAAVLAKTIANKPIDGVPEEMQLLAASLHSEEEADRSLLEALCHDFGEVEETFDFEGLVTVERYADGYSKIYITEELAEDIPEDFNTYIALDGTDWSTHAMIGSPPYTWCRSGNGVVDVPTSACVYQDNGSVVIYQFPYEYSTAVGEPLLLTIGNNETDEIYMELTREETHRAQEEDLPVEDAPEEEPEEMPASEPRLAELLDLSKAWNSIEPSEISSDTYSIGFAFSPDGSVICLTGWAYSSVMGVYEGTYYEENGRVFFSFPSMGLECSYRIMEQNGGVVLVQDSPEGIFYYHEPGHTLTLEEHNLTPDRYKEMLDLYNSGGFDPGI